jgi:hypothetical protein
MIAFNLERALAGEPVITRDGKEVTQLVYFESIDDYRVYGVVDKRVKLWAIGGEFWKGGEGPLDLFMKPKENAIWLNVYKDRDSGELFIGQAYKEESLAQRAINSTHAEHIRTIKIDDKK